jgi:hypothetical protein
VPSLGTDKANEIAVWKQKYGNLVRTFALDNINDPNFDTKLNEFLEKKVLSEMVESWFAMDETDRQRKFEEAQKAVGQAPQTTTAGKRLIGTSGGKPVYDLGNGKWQVGD